jgi:hypothetical protein
VVVVLDDTVDVAQVPCAPPSSARELRSVRAVRIGTQRQSPSFGPLPGVDCRRELALLADLDGS